MSLPTCQKQRSMRRRCTRRARYRLAYVTRVEWVQPRDKTLAAYPVEHHREWDACQRCGDRARRHGATVLERYARASA